MPTIRSIKRRQTPFLSCANLNPLFWGIADSPAADHPINYFQTRRVQRVASAHPGDVQLSRRSLLAASYAQPRGAS